MAEPDPPELDLAELEFERGVELTHWVDEVRARLRTHGRLRVRHCPQMLAHTLYKVGMLRDGRLELVDTREEEPYG